MAGGSSQDGCMGTVSGVSQKGEQAEKSVQAVGETGQALEIPKGVTVL